MDGDTPESSMYVQYGFINFNIRGDLEIGTVPIFPPPSSTIGACHFALLNVEETSETTEIDRSITNVGEKIASLRYRREVPAWEGMDIPEVTFDFADLVSSSVPDNDETVLIADKKIRAITGLTGSVINDVPFLHQDKLHTPPHAKGLVKLEATYAETKISDVTISIGPIGFDQYESPP